MTGHAIRLDDFVNNCITSKHSKLSITAPEISQNPKKPAVVVIVLDNGDQSFELPTFMRKRLKLWDN